MSPTAITSLKRSPGQLDIYRPLKLRSCPLLSVLPKTIPIKEIHHWSGFTHRRGCLLSRTRLPIRRPTTPHDGRRAVTGWSRLVSQPAGNVPNSAELRARIAARCDAIHVGGWQQDGGSDLRVRSRSASKKKPQLESRGPDCFPHQPRDHCSGITTAARPWTA